MTRYENAVKEFSDIVFSPDKCSSCLVNPCCSVMCEEQVNRGFRIVKLIEIIYLEKRKKEDGSKKIDENNQRDMDIHMSASMG